MTKESLHKSIKVQSNDSSIRQRPHTNSVGSNSRMDAER